MTDRKETSARNGRPPRRHRGGTIPMAGIAVTCAVAAFAMPAMAATMAVPLMESTTTGAAYAGNGASTDVSSNLTSLTASEVQAQASSSTGTATVEDVLRAADAPFADALQTKMVPLLDSEEKIDAAKSVVDGATDAELTLDGKQVSRDEYLGKLDSAKAKLGYLTAHADEVAASVIHLSQLGSRFTDQGRTLQSFMFDNADITGFYIRPGITARFRIYVDGPATSSVTWAHRQAGRVDQNNYALVRADDGGTLKPGVNEVTYDTTGRQVGQVLYLRNDSLDPVTVRIEGADADDANPVTGTSLGQYPHYVYDEDHPEAFWTYVQELRRYVEAGVDQKAGDIVSDPKLGMDVTGLLLGRGAYEVRAAKAVEAFKDIADEQSAVAYVKNMDAVTNGRLKFFDKLQGFDEHDADTRQKPSKLYVYVELTQNLTSPSSMFAWYTMYHLPESVFPSIATSVEAAHGWANDHEFGHMLDIQPLTIAEETNNIFSLWGRREAQIDAMNTSGKAFDFSTYHPNAIASTTQYEQWINDKLAGKNPDSKWGDIWYDVDVRWSILHYFDDYDYSGYDFSKGPYTRELADQVKEYGGLGAVYRQVRRDRASYLNVGGAFDAAVRAYSDALGFDMAEFLGRSGLTKITDATKEYAARYPKLSQRAEFYTLRSDMLGINGAKAYTASTKAPDTTVARTSGDTLAISASYPSDSDEAKSTTGYVLLADGKEVGYSTDGKFTVSPGKELPEYSVVAYDYRVNPSPAASVRLKADVDVKVVVIGGDAKVTDASIKVASDDPRAQETTQKATAQMTTLKGIGPSTVSVSLDGYTSYPDAAHVDSVTWTGGTLQFTLVKSGETKVGTALRPIISGEAGADGSLQLTIADPNTGGSDIYYTTDGSEPTSVNGTRWTGAPIAISSSPVTIKARAYKARLLPSQVATATFTDSRQVTIWNQIWGPSYGSGQSKSFGIGEYRGKDALDFLYDEVRSLRVPDGLKVTLYEGENLDGKKHEYTQTVDWVNLYDAFPIKSIKVETIKAPEAKKDGMMYFDPGNESTGTQVLGTMNPITMYEGVSVTVPDVKYTRSGYTSIGYRIIDTQTQVEPGSQYVPNGKDVRLQAKWAKAVYRVAFDANGGTGTMETMMAEVGGQVTFPASSFTRTGYKFAGWKLPDGTVIADGGTVTIAGTEEDDIVTASAQWDPIRYSVKFAAGEGATGSMGDIELAYDENRELPASAFSNAEYDFDGWVDDQGRKYADGQSIQNLTDRDGGTVTLTAQWVKHEDKPSGGDNQNGGGTDIPSGDGNENADNGGSSTGDANESDDARTSDLDNAGGASGSTSNSVDADGNGASHDRGGSKDGSTGKMVATGDMLVPALVGVAVLAVAGIVVSIIIKSRK